MAGGGHACYIHGTLTGCRIVHAVQYGPVWGRVLPGRAGGEGTNSTLTQLAQAQSIGVQQEAGRGQ